MVPELRKVRIARNMYLGEEVMLLLNDDGDRAVYCLSCGTSRTQCPFA